MARDFSDPNIARRAAQFLVQSGFDATKAAQLMDPSPRSHYALGRRMADSPEVQEQVRLILNRTERNSDRFMKLMWDWLEAETPDKDSSENKRTAARILAKGYISEKKGPEAPNAKLVIQGLEDADLSNLTGDAQVTPRKKVM